MKLPPKIPRKHTSKTQIGPSKPKHQDANRKGKASLATFLTAIKNWLSKNIGQPIVRLFSRKATDLTNTAEKPEFLTNTSPKNKDLEHKQTPPPLPPKPKKHKPTTEVQEQRTSSPDEVSKPPPLPPKPKIYPRITRKSVGDGGFYGITNKMPLGSKMSTEAAQKLSELGFNHVYDPFGDGDCSVISLLLLIASESKEHAELNINTNPVDNPAVNNSEGRVTSGLAQLNTHLESPENISIEQLIQTLAGDQQTRPAEFLNAVAGLRQILYDVIQSTQPGELAEILGFEVDESTAEMLKQMYLEPISALSGDRDIDADALRIFIAKTNLDADIIHVDGNNVEVLGGGDPLKKHAIVLNKGHFFVVTRQDLDPASISRPGQQ